jgi:hypothetical protein
MFSNGIISFVDPYQSGLAWSNLSAQPFSNSMGSQFNYSIYPLWTDLINITGSFTTQGSTQFQRYNWVGISPYYDSTRINTFSVELRPDGKIITNYSLVNADYAGVGMVGNAANGEYEQVAFSWSGVNSIANWERYTYAVDQCSIDPLHSVDCAGYAEAYLNQQCSFSALYSPSCPGYAEAYLQEQCSISALYSPSCPGYGLAMSQQLQQSQTTATAPATSTTTDTSTSATTDPTRTDATVVTDVGGMEITATGQLQVADGVPQSSKDLLVEQEQRTVTSPANLLSIARAASSDTLARSVAQQQSQQSNNEANNPADGLGLGEGITLSRITAGQTTLGTDADRTETQTRTTNATALTNSTATASEQRQDTPRTGSSVRNGGAVSELAGGPDMQDFSKPPADFASYFVGLRDAQFYAPKEIYRAQRTVDNQRLLRGLTQGSDRLHEQMIDQQYQPRN